MTHRSESDSVDAIVVVPPLSPSDTNPPLGPYLLRTCFERAGLTLNVCDLNIAYLRLFGESSGGRLPALLGDQDKDRELIRRARKQFREHSPLSVAVPIEVPCCCDPLMGMHFGFEEIERAVCGAAGREHFWSQFTRTHLFAGTRAPRVLGLPSANAFITMNAATPAMRSSTIAFEPFDTAISIFSSTGCAMARSLPRAFRGVRS